MTEKLDKRLIQFLKETANIAKKFDHHMCLKYHNWIKEVEKNQIKSSDFKNWLQLQGERLKEKDLDFACYLYRRSGD